MNNNFGEEMLAALREKMKNEMGEKRYNHTLEVEKMAARLGEIYAPDKISALRAAALLHDVTKERTVDEHIAICESAGLVVSRAELKSPKMFHAKTGALVILQKYPQFATDEIVNAVRYHTTGKADMSIMEKIIYLADYIDMSRTFEDCVALRNFFFDFDFDNASEKEKLEHLNDTLIMSYDLTIRGLLEDGKHINDTTFEARNFLILEK
jgi:predicted HD superfamily hydrolase involved in NAD metabolism